MDLRRSLTECLAREPSHRAEVTDESGIPADLKE